MKRHMGVIFTGVLIGIAALMLTAMGNPGNMGFCIACFIRDTAGSMKLHNAEPLQYFRPETAGIVLGAFLAAVFTKEFRARAVHLP